MIRPIALTLILVATLIAGTADAPELSLSPPQWQELAPGIQQARVEAERYCLAGSNEVLLLRLDPARCRLAPFHESEFPDAGPATLTTWSERLESSLVVNAGLYDPQRVHLGRLQRDGTDLGGVQHTVWKGYLAVAPVAAEGDTVGLPRACLLEEEDPRTAALLPRYQTVVQTMVLFDRDGTLRVRESDKIARRVILAEDGRGRLFLVVTQGLYRLADMARLLHNANLDLRLALVLDGGSEAQVGFTTNAGIELYPDDLFPPPTPPAVLAVFPDAP